MNPYGGYNHYNQYATHGKQYISQNIQNVTVGCYLGREAHSGDYSMINMSKFVSHKDPFEAKSQSKDKGQKKPKIRYVNCQNYLID